MLRRLKRRVSLILIPTRCIIRVTKMPYIRHSGSLFIASTRLLWLMTILYGQHYLLRFCAELLLGKLLLRLTTPSL
nr:MAG: hypothetical protein [Actinidia virus 1]UIW14025.1 MAG: hypothetical protein [Actinidia virus 1]